MICGWVFLKIFVQVWNIYIKKRKSESRLAPALLSPHATVGDLAKTHCSAAGLSAADAEHGNVQSNCSEYFLTNIFFQPLRINMRGCLPDQLWTFHISSVPIAYQLIYLRKRSSYLLLFSIDHIYQLWKSIIYIYFTSFTVFFVSLSNYTLHVIWNINLHLNNNFAKKFTKLINI